MENDRLKAIYANLKDNICLSGDFRELHKYVSQILHKKTYYGDKAEIIASCVITKLFMRFRRLRDNEIIFPKGLLGSVVNGCIADYHDEENKHHPHEDPTNVPQGRKGKGNRDVSPHTGSNVESEADPGRYGAKNLGEFANTISDVESEADCNRSLHRLNEVFKETLVENPAVAWAAAYKLELIELPSGEKLMDIYSNLAMQHGKVSCDALRKEVERFVDHLSENLGRPKNKRSHE